MTEYTDLKNRTYGVIEIIRDHSREWKSEEPRESAERQIVNAKRMSPC